MATAVETHQFQAETRQLLELMIHSLYTNKEIFLRELISNSSDAIDRLRFEALTSPELMDSEEELGIRLESDGEARTLTIHDNGIGMSRDEVIQNIGTIAKSGSREVMERLESGESDEAVAQLIGQFGVGFYSAFMVADHVTLLTRRAGEEGATLWQSAGDGQYTLVEADRPTRGTSITLRLKPENKEDGLDDFTDEWVLSRIVKRYSDFVSYPIQMKVEREQAVRDEEGEAEEGETETVIEDKTLNSMKPIWTRAESEISEREYAEFYKHISHDWNEPMRHLMLRAEGRVEYQALLFFPSEAPYDLFYIAYEPGLQLYVKKVLIMEKCKELMPRYLRFIKGVVDAPDLPLNVSREMLQHDRHITQMRRWLTRKVLDTLRKMQQDEAEEYLGFWNNFGRALKEGISEDFDNKDKLIELLLFESSNHESELTTLADYVERMGEGQEPIYYLTGESRAQVENSPHLEAFKEKGIEVLYLVDPVDELLMQSVTEYEEKNLKSVGKGTVELGDEEEREAKKAELEEQEGRHSSLLEAMQQELDEWVKQVRLSNRLTTSPVCLVGAEHDYSPQLERLLQKGKGGGPAQRRILELNPNHAIVSNLLARHAANAEDPAIGDASHVLFGFGLLAEGAELPDPVRFSNLVAGLMESNLATGVDASAAPASEEPTEEPESADAADAEGDSEAEKPPAGGGEGEASDD